MYTYRCSVLCVPTSDSYHSSTPAWHATDKSLDDIRGMTLHSSNNASVSSWSVRGCCGRFWIYQPSKSHRCSIQFRSGLHVGQSITWIPAASRNSLVSIAEYAGAPSCINVKFYPIISAMGSTWFTRSSWMLCTAFNSPWMNTKSLFWLKEISPHTTADPPL